MDINPGLANTFQMMVVWFSYVQVHQEKGLGSTFMLTQGFGVGRPQGDYLAKNSTIQHRVLTGLYSCNARV